MRRIYRILSQTPCVESSVSQCNYRHIDIQEEAEEEEEEEEEVALGSIAQWADCAG